MKHIDSIVAYHTPDVILWPQRHGRVVMRDIRDGRGGGDVAGCAVVQQRRTNADKEPGVGKIIRRLSYKLEINTSQWAQYWSRSYVKSW